MKINLITKFITSLALCALLASCGGSDAPPLPVVYSSEWDGSVRQVESYLKANLNDADSYEGVEWSKVVVDSQSATSRFIVRHKYRAKNLFGGYAIANQVFYLDTAGNVTNVEDYQL